MTPTSPNVPHTCLHCGNFVDEPHALEAELPGLVVFSSARGEARGAAGVCRRQSLWQDPRPACSGFVARTGRTVQRP